MNESILWGNYNILKLLSEGQVKKGPSNIRHRVANLCSIDRSFKHS